jgi:predicted nucleic acid-binding protein
MPKRAAESTTWSMGTRNEAYVDTSAFIAFVDRSDSHHPLFRRLFSEAPSLVTTPLVVAEGHGWFLRRYDSTRALQFLAMIEAMKPLTVLAVGGGEQAAAIEILRELSDQRLTLADAMGLHLMAERASSCCWSTDRHLGLTGVPLAIHQH